MVAMASPRSLIIRAEANARMGTGHLMRCLALAQEWKVRGGQATFITVCESEALLRRISTEGFEVIRLERSYPDPADWNITSQVLAAHSGAWVVLDGYHFDTVYQHQIKEAGHRLLVIDDTAHLGHYYADVVLNQNINAERSLYSHEPYTHLLLGTRYALLRLEFLTWRGWQREILPVARKVLVTLGGSDADNVICKVIQAFQQVEENKIEVEIVVGGGNPHYEELQSAIVDSRRPIHLKSNETNMPELMAWADLAIAAAGTTSWELAFMGLPSLLLVLADNQRTNAEQLSMVGAAVNLGWHKNVSPARIAQAMTKLVATANVRKEMSRSGQQLVDGKGTDRVLEHIKGETVKLRQVREDDCRLLWEWANDPDVRAGSFSSEPIPWEQHIQWFKSKINDPNCVSYIAMDNKDTPIGQVRYDLDGNEAEISVSADRRFRGKDHGSTMIRLASEKLFDTSEVGVIHAYIKQDNVRSYHAFVKAGYRDIGTATVRGHYAVHLVLRKWN